MKDRPRLSDLTAGELLERAAEYRLMAATARMPGIQSSLLRLAEMFEKLAAARTNRC